MEQAAYQSRGGEFAELRAYVLAKLLWDPECNVEEVINDFMYGYYGRSGQFVRQYFDLLHNQLTPDTHIHLGLKPEDILFSDEFVRQAEMIFDRAEGVADSEAIGSASRWPACPSCTSSVSGNLSRPNATAPTPDSAKSSSAKALRTTPNAAPNTASNSTPEMDGIE